MCYTGIMLPFGAIGKKINKLVLAGADFFAGLAEKIAALGFVTKARELAKSALDRLLEKIPEEKRRLALACAGGGIALVLLIAAGVSLGRGKNRENPPAENPLTRRAVIPPEELFLPGEPDFIPGVILERERRASWTAEDAAPYWQDPLKNGEEQWRQRVENSIDELLEQVP
jgi:hypothetical protein